MTLSSLQARGDKDLKYLDRKLGIDAIYYTPSSSSISGSITDGATTIPYTATPNVRVRSAGLSSVELAALANAGLGQVSAVWYMRSAYISEVLPGHVLLISSFYYEVIKDGNTLDDLGTLWTIATRRRPSI